MAVVGPAVLDFSSPQDARYFGGDNSWLIPLLENQREAMLTSDAWRSLIFIVAAALLTYVYVKSDKLKTPLFAVCLGALVVLDMWPVNKRYMNDTMFSTPKNFQSSFTEQPYETQILRDTDPHFRVLNLAANTFNDARTSYRLKSLGGYSAAKLRRYQDLIDEHLSKMHMPVVNMLNAKYVIVPGSDGQPQPQLNAGAMGNAWFVDSLVVVDNANAESDALMQYDLRHVAVADKAFAEQLPATPLAADSLASVRLTTYTPEYIEYDASCSRPGTIVFSEIYYPYGWKAIVDGEPADHYRVNYMLRALNVTPGQHHIRFEFRPDSVALGNKIAMTFVIIMYLTTITLLLAGIWMFVRTSRQGA